MSSGSLSKPLISITITPKTVANADRLARALAPLTAEDRQLRILSPPSTSEVVLGFATEQHLVETIDRLREFGVEATASLPRVIYREALTRPADGEAKHAKQTGGRGEYGHVKLRIQPRERGLSQPYETRGGMRVIRALVPLASLFGFATDLRSKTYGHGSYTAEFHAFVPCEIAGDDEPDSRVREPRQPPPKPRDSTIALPEPRDPNEQ